MIDLWIKGFATTISTVFNKTAPQSFCVSLPNIYEAASLSRIFGDVSEEKSLPYHFLYIADLVYDTSKIDIFLLWKGVNVWLALEEMYKLKC